MTYIHTTIDIQAPPDRVWAAVRDIEHWCEWAPTVISVRPLDPGPLAVGNRAIVRQPKLLPARWQITELEEGRSFTWITRGPGILVTARHSIEGAGNGTRATLSLDFSGPFGPLCARLTRGLNTRYLALEARGLKKRAEAEARSQASNIGSSGGSR
jgi:carbon monoxide dehydrogenase subunit G